MFWKYNNPSSSQIDTLLKEDATLQKLMDEEDIINECKVHNKPLIEYLSKPEVMEELVSLTCMEPSPELDERSRFKYPNIACELLTCDVPALNERLAGDNALLAKLYSFLESEPPLNPLMASFFSKIMGALIAKKTEQVLEFLKAKDEFIPLLLKHIGTSAIMDLTLKLMTQVDGAEMRQNILNWLDSTNIIRALVALLDPKIDADRHSNVAQLLCDFIKVARDTLRNATERADPNPLLNTLESPETVSLLLDQILVEEKSETAIVGGIKILLTLLDINKTSIPKYDSQNIYDSSSYDDTSDLEYRERVLQSVASALQKRMKDFHNLLINPPLKNSIETTVGTLAPPLGSTRLQVTKLIAATISSNNVDLVQELISLGTMQVLLDLFFKYQWNNFLHTQVETCITSALKAHVPQEMGDCNALSKHLLVNCKLVERILDAWKENDIEQTKGGPRKGYMGHLITLANQLVQLCTTTTLGEFLKTSLPEVAESLEQFKNSALSETNKTREILLGGVQPNISNEDSDEYGDLPFLQSEMVEQQMFSQFQMQQLTPQIIETYGFSDDDFNGGDDTLQTIDHRTNMNFDLSEGDFAQQHELFKQICAMNINTLDDADDQIFEDRDHTFQTVIEKQGEKSYSSDSDDDTPPPTEDPLMDIDPWSATVDKSEAAVLPEDPWGLMDNKKSGDNDVGNWADFSSASFADFSSGLSANGAWEGKGESIKSIEIKDGSETVKTIAQNVGTVQESNNTETDIVEKSESVSVSSVSQMTEQNVEKQSESVASANLESDKQDA